MRDNGITMGQSVCNQVVVSHLKESADRTRFIWLACCPVLTVLSVVRSFASGGKKKSEPSPEAGTEVKSIVKILCLDEYISIEKIGHYAITPKLRPSF